MKSIRPMYIFTILCVLLVFSLVLLAFVVKSGQDNAAVLAVLNTAVGALLTGIMTVVNYEFGSAKQSAERARASDTATLTVSTPDGDTATATAGTTGVKP